ncbi:MAG: hypothetical protein FRX48_02678 [Lasallia pustulata]|uniref:Uncharacterized protein n=1 Tax=Lasallia pustulata TaxID=136370 RepID=A0A5M8PXB9_9LECA|nr:MAG: hypothetical protein FRX48_02678 [Lasallia pustulata]
MAMQLPEVVPLVSAELVSAELAHTLLYSTNLSETLPAGVSQEVSFESRANVHACTPTHRSTCSHALNPEPLQLKATYIAVTQKKLSNRDKDLADGKCAHISPSGDRFEAQGCRLIPDIVSMGKRRQVDSLPMYPRRGSDEAALQRKASFLELAVLEFTLQSCFYPCIK